jgi:hypothetical protein
MNNPQQKKLASFRDLMEAKMEREKREVEVTNSQIDSAPKLEIVPKNPELRIDHLDPLDPLDHLSKYNRNHPVSAVKDYSKLPNSIKRAIKQGVFQGCSLQIYLYLFSLTRGAIQPRRKVRTTKPKIKVGAGVGSDVTLNKHLSHLKSLGYLAITEIRGQYHGNEYEVFIPEEIASDSLDYLDSLESLDLQKIDRLDLLDSRPSIPSQTIENKEDSDALRHSLKTNTKTDDEPFGKMIETLAKVFEKVSGKPPQKSDAAKLNELAELLAMELEIAAARTKSISNVPAFLTEHLRRRLLGSSAKSAEGKFKTSKSIKAGKSEKIVEEYQAEPLSKEGREAVLKTMREYIGKGQQEFVMSQQDTYTKDDWDWLMHQLENE